MTCSRRASSAFADHPSRITKVIFSILAGTVGVFVGMGVAMPAFTLDELGTDPSTFSVIGGGMDLLRNGNAGLGMTILCFSVVFPIAKLFGLSAIVWSESSAKKQFWRLRLLELLGKWSMLDVFVVATLIAAAQLGILSDVSAREGIYLFMFAIIGSILLTAAVTYGLGPVQSLRRVPAARYWELLGIGFSAAGLLLFALSIDRSLLVVEKWFFWENDYSLLSAIPRLDAEGEHLLAGVFLTFVIILPFCQFLTVLGVRLRPSQRWLVKLAYHLNKWSMIEVYLLALLVFVIKIGDFATVELRLGFWLFAAAAVVAVVDEIVLRRQISARPQSDTAVV